jgi:4-cresol dehydrogenase (hydroxylating)
MSGLVEALEAWRAAIGEDYVRTDPVTLRQVETATFATYQEVPALLLPGSRGEVQRCVRIANTYKMPLYPVSTGKNWGYGSRVPTYDGCVVMSLERLNRIVDFSEELAYITVEPGVTFLDVNRFLAERGSTLKVNITGSTYESSLIGNALERGLGTGIYGDRAAHVCDMEIVLPTGEHLRTGFGRFEGAAASVNRWGVGPSLDGLFTQSNLGIVTRMTFWLMPISKHRYSCYFATGPDGLESLIDALHHLRSFGICNEPIRLYNDYRALSGIVQFPWHAIGADDFLTPEVMSSIREALGIGAWLGELHIDAHSPAQALASQELVYISLQGVTNNLYFVDTGGRQWVPITGNATEENGGPFTLQPRPATEQGRSLETPGGIRNTYWRKRIPVPGKMDPDRDRCGVLWCAPAVPFTGRHIVRAVRCMENVILSDRYEPNISLVLLTERCAIVNAALLYDREVPGEDDRAMQCYHTLLRELIGMKYLPYRLGIQSMDSLPASSGDYDAFLARLKKALDPNDILAPRRYDFRANWPHDITD